MADDKDKKIEDEDVLGFDPSLKKKKKKKKVRIEGEGGDDEVDLIAEAVAEVTVREAVKEAEEAEGDDDLDLTKKKKKKKKPTEGEAAAEPEADEDDLSKKKKKKSKDAKVEEPVAEPAAKEESDDEMELLKKKKKKVAAPAATKDAEGSDDDGEGEGDDVEIADLADDGGIVFGDDGAGDAMDGAVSFNASKGPLPWAGSDRDYTYQELLTRVMETLREKNPELRGEKKRFIMKPPQVVKEGSKKTLFINFKDICKILRRNHEHVYQFILAELGTSGSIDGAERMIIKGRFQPKAIENIIRHYVVEYVTCHSCKSPDTLLHKDNRLFFLVCNQCGAQRSVASIKTGYVAQVGKRKKV